MHGSRSEFFVFRNTYSSLYNYVIIFSPIISIEHIIYVPHNYVLIHVCIWIHTCGNVDNVIISLLWFYCVVVQHPLNTTVCQGDNAGFTCVLFIQSGALVIPGWHRNGTNVDMIRHTITGNLTNVSVAPTYISSRVTISSVTVSDDGSLYQCGILSFITSNSATLKVVGKCICHNLMFL